MGPLQDGDWKERWGGVIWGIGGWRRRDTPPGRNWGRALALSRRAAESRPNPLLCGDGKDNLDKKLTFCPLSHPLSVIPSSNKVSSSSIDKNGWLIFRWKHVTSPVDAHELVIYEGEDGGSGWWEGEWVVSRTINYFLSVNGSWAD